EECLRLGLAQVPDQGLWRLPHNQKGRARLIDQVPARRPDLHWIRGRGGHRRRHHQHAYSRYHASAPHRPPPPAPCLDHLPESRRHVIDPYGAALIPQRTVSPRRKRRSWWPAPQPAASTDAGGCTAVAALPTLGGPHPEVGTICWSRGRPWILASPTPSAQ